MRLEHTIAIDAPPETVWRISTDVERWPDWTPTVRAAERLEPTAFGLGSTVRLKQPGMSSAVWRVIDFEPGRSFTWETGTRLLQMVASHRLEPVAEGTRNTLTLRITGMLVSALYPLVWANAVRSLARENSGLKAACEADAREAG